MIQLSDHFNIKRLLCFIFPSIIMLMFTSVYGVVDGFFVSNFVGKTPFTAVNFIMPYLMILGCVGFLFGTGGGALIARTMGEGKTERANQLFSLLVYVSIACGVVLAVFGIVFIRPAAYALGARGQLLHDSVAYGRVTLPAIPAYVLQYEFQCLFATAEKPKLGLYITIAAGMTNILLDALFVGVLSWGLAGAAVATALGQCIGGIAPLIYFSRPNTSLLRLTKTGFDGSALCKAVTNGSSELMTNISVSMVSMLYNVQLLKYAGEDGVAAYGVLMYVNLVFQAVFIGYSVGSAPVISYHYGAGNHSELKGLRKKSLVIIAVSAVCMFAAAELLSGSVASVFVGYDQRLFEMTVNAFQIFSFSFLFAGFGIFGSAFFTALNNGFLSALIAFLRTLIFQVAAVLILPVFWQVDGIWFSMVAAEMLSLGVVVFLLVHSRKMYQI